MYRYRVAEMRHSLVIINFKLLVKLYKEIDNTVIVKRMSFFWHFSILGDFYYYYCNQNVIAESLVPELIASLELAWCRYPE